MKFSGTQAMVLTERPVRDALDSHLKEQGRGYGSPPPHMFGRELTDDIATKHGLGTHVWLLPTAHIFDIVKSCIQVCGKATV